MDTPLNPPLSSETISKVRAIYDSRDEKGGISTPSPKDARALQKTLLQLQTQLTDRAVAVYFHELLQSYDDQEPLETFYRLPHLIDALTYQPAKPETRGRKNLPYWMREAATCLVDYYRITTGDASGPYYNDNNDPANDFTKWFHSAMAEIFPGKEITSSNCRTILEPFKIRAKKQPY